MARRILIVEDVALVAMDLEMQAMDAGWTVAGPASTVAEALSIVRDDCICAAILDIEVGGELVTPVARVLKARGIPFAFGSGHKACSFIPDDLRDARCLDKPFTFADVERVLGPAFAAQQAEPA